MNDYRSVLSRCGWVLIVAGLIDIGFTVWSIMNQADYSSSINIFGLIAGILLIRGSLKTAGIISFLAAFSIAAVVVVVAILPFFFPLDLVRTYLRMQPLSALLPGFEGTSILLLTIWIYRELTSPPVRAAMVEGQAGSTSRLRRPTSGFWIGGLLAVSLLAFLASFMGGSTARQAKQKAATEIGPGYKLAVTSLNISSDRGTKHVQAVVTAYTDQEIKRLYVEWSE